MEIKRESKNLEFWTAESQNKLSQKDNQEQINHPKYNSERNFEKQLSQYKMNINGWI